jgi:hypothetical protein
LLLDGSDCRIEIHSKKKVFYQTLKGSSPGHTGRTFGGSVYKGFVLKVS